MVDIPAQAEVVEKAKIAALQDFYIAALMDILRPIQARVAGAAPWSVPGNAWSSMVLGILDSVHSRNRQGLSAKTPL